MAATGADIASTLNIAGSTTSYHLQLLMKAGLVQYSRAGHQKLFVGTGVRLAIVTEDELGALELG